MRPSELKGNIARRLGKYSWDTILWALDEMPEVHVKFPPTIPEIAELCKRRPKPQEYFTALPAPTITQEEAERRGREMEEIGRASCRERV